MSSDVYDLTMLQLIPHLVLQPPPNFVLNLRRSQILCCCHVLHECVFGLQVCGFVATVEDCMRDGAGEDGLTQGPVNLN